MILYSWSNRAKGRNRKSDDALAYVTLIPRENNGGFSGSGTGEWQRSESSTTSKEGLERSPQDQVNATTNDESSPKTIEAMTGVDLQRGVTVTQPH